MGEQEVERPQRGPTLELWISGHKSNINKLCAFANKCLPKAKICHSVASRLPPMVPKRSLKFSQNMPGIK